MPGIVMGLLIFGLDELVPNIGNVVIGIIAAITINIINTNAFILTEEPEILEVFSEKNAKNLIQVTWLNWLENSTDCSFTISIKEALRGSNLT